MIANVKSTEGVGDGVFKKTIHKGSESIMFSVLQETQYMYPIKSSVREIVSNCLDSITERNNARKILNGEINPEDLYIVKEGTEFTDSGFNRAYYDLKWLSEDDTVTLLYIDNDSETRDRIKFIDRGVGLGGTRLINYFSLGFSSKRLSKNQLGSFGLGAKSLLATGVDFYTVTSYYNGREYSFNIFKDHVLSNISKFNDDGTANPTEVFFEGEENEYTVYYRNTTELNGVTIETEVKRHKKQDFITSIENQLGYIKNIELLIQDTQYEYLAPTKRNIAANILYSTDKLLVGESDYYAIPQILLKPGADSTTMISYGTINFEELEMKKYSGNVSFIMNINEVDVTPSREHVIWNSKTREAIKNMFLTAQKTVADMIEDKLAAETNLPDYLALHGTMKEKTSASGIAELYKIIDFHKIENTFRGFVIADVALEINREYANELIFTSTPMQYSPYNSPRTVHDTNFASALSKEYISKLSTKNDKSDLVLLIGDGRQKGLARYVADVYDLKGNNVDMLYVKEELFNTYVKNASQGGLEESIEEAYRSKNFFDVIMLEIVRFATNDATKGRVLHYSDISQSKMNDLAKNEETVKSNRNMTTAERAKLAGKVIGNLHCSYANTYRDYYDENILETKARERTVIIYQMGDKNVESLLKNAVRTSIPDHIMLIGFSQDNFKRFYKLPGIVEFSNSIFEINFGDITFTEFGKNLLPNNIQQQLANLYNQDAVDIDLKYTSFRYLIDVYRDISLNITTFNSTVNHKVSRLKERYIEYNTDPKPCKCDRCKTIEKVK